MRFRWHFGGILPPQMEPSCFPERVKKRCKNMMIPKSGLGAPKSVQRAPQGRPRAPNEHPKGAQEHPKRAPRAPQSVQVGTFSGIPRITLRNNKKNKEKRREATKCNKQNQRKELKLTTPLSVHSCSGCLLSSWSTRPEAKRLGGL